MTSINSDVPPPPFEGRPKRRRPRWLTLVAIGAGLMLIAAAFVVPLEAFYVFEPGPVMDVERLVEVDERQTYSSEGELFLTTVGVDVNVTLYDWLRASLGSDREVILKSAYTQGRPDEEVERQARLEMQLSKRNAKEVALNALGIAKPLPGVAVVETVPGTPAAGDIEKGDIILMLDGKPVCAPQDVIDVLSKKEIGAEVRLVVSRDDKRIRLRLTTVENPQAEGLPFLGVQLDELDRPFKAGTGIDFKTGRVGGPSAGLMLSLALYDRLTPDDLTGGREIAGTGTISCNGSVGPIGGVALKIAGAEKEGAQVFLAPDGDAEAARRAASEIEVVAISSFDEAVDYLEGHK